MWYLRTKPDLVIVITTKLVRYETDDLMTYLVFVDDPVKCRKQFANRTMQTPPASSCLLTDGNISCVRLRR